MKGIKKKVIFSKYFLLVERYSAFINAMLWIWNVPKGQCVKGLVHILLHWCGTDLEAGRSFQGWGWVGVLPAIGCVPSSLLSLAPSWALTSSPAMKCCLSTVVQTQGQACSVPSQTGGQRPNFLGMIEAIRMLCILLSKDGVFARTSYSPCSDGWHIWGEFWNSTIAIVMKYFSCLEDEVWAHREGFLSTSTLAVCLISLLAFTKGQS